MSFQALMTPDCQVICIREDGQLYTCPLTGPEPPKEMVSLVQQGAQWYIRSVSEPSLWYDPNTQKMVSLLPAQGIDAIVRGVALKALCLNGHYLSVDWSGNVCFDTQDGGSAVVLRCIEWPDFILLWEMVNQDWVCAPDGQQVKVQLEHSTLKDICIGSIKVSFEQFIDAAQQYKKIGELLLNEEWRVWRFVKYNPVIIFDAFGQKSLYELNIALQSLSDIAHYDGAVIVITDQSEDSVRACLLDLYERFSIRLVVIGDCDRFASFRTRSRLIKDPLFLQEYAPLVFVRSSVLFGKATESFLLQSSLLRTVSAREYFFHPEFCTDIQEHKTAEELKAGQTADMLVVPYMGKHRPYLEKAFDLLTLCLKEYGESAIPQEVQSIINYGLRQVGDFSSALVENFISFDGDENFNLLHTVGIINIEKDDECCEKMARYYENIKELWGAGV